MRTTLFDRVMSSDVLEGLEGAGVPTPEEIASRYKSIVRRDQVARLDIRLDRLQVHSDRMRNTPRDHPDRQRHVAAATNFVRTSGLADPSDPSHEVARKSIAYMRSAHGVG